MRKVLLVLMALALVVFFGANHAVHADSNIIPAIKAGGGWTTVVSYINTQPAVGTVRVHATYQVKNLANLLDPCTHLDGRTTTTLNDLTTTVISTTGGGLGTVFPAADTVGGAILTPPTLAGLATTEGFLVLENYTEAAPPMGAVGTLTSEAIVFNLASGFLYSQRGLNTTHVAASPGGNVTIDVPGIAAPLEPNVLRSDRTRGVVVANNNVPNTANLTRFAFLPSATATTGGYIIAINLANTAGAAVEPATTLNLVAADYNARIRLESRMDSAQAYALGVYDRLEDFRSITTANDVVCVVQMTPAQILGAVGIPAFIANGGWMNLSPRCRQTSDGGVTFAACPAAVPAAAESERGDAAIIYKVEFAAGYGFAVTPQHQQWYTK